MKNIMGHLPDLWYNYKTLLKYFGCHTVTFDRSDITKSSGSAVMNHETTKFDWN